ncbi:collagen triple helix repeat-containing protein, partial [Elysia marginata]
MASLDLSDVRHLSPWLVATATFGVLPIALVTMCVSGAVIAVNSGSNKNLYSFFNVQMALCDFLMAVGPMVLFFAMVTGRIDLQANEANHFGCLTGVVLSYTTSDISAIMLVLYVVAAYHHIYYINVSWYQAQINKIDEADDADDADGADDIDGADGADDADDIDGADGDDGADDADGADGADGADEQAAVELSLCVPGAVCSQHVRPGRHSQRERPVHQSAACFPVWTHRLYPGRSNTRLAWNSRVGLSHEHTAFGPYPAEQSECTGTGTSMFAALETWTCGLPLVNNGKLSSVFVNLWQRQLNPDRSINSNSNPAFEAFKYLKVPLRYR